MPTEQERIRASRYHQKTTDPRLPPLRSQEDLDDEDREGPGPLAPMLFLAVIGYTALFWIFL